LGFWTTVPVRYIQHSFQGASCAEMDPDEEIAMTTIQPVLYALSLFLALASLLRWKYLREDTTPQRVRRSLRTYFTITASPRLEIA
jgi:hypothetical protein